LHYFGWFALVTGPLLALDALRMRLRWHRGLVLVGAAAVLTLAFQPALRQRLFLPYAPGMAPDYASALPLYLQLAPLCEADPGVVLAHSDDGSALLFHTECSVISNNFILRPQDEVHILEIHDLLRSTPDEIRQRRPDVKYLLLRARDFFVPVGDTLDLDPQNAVAQQLLTDAEPPQGFELLKTVVLQLSSDGDTAIFARLYRVHPVDRADASREPPVSRSSDEAESVL
jgi:hypothetical protein